MRIESDRSRRHGACRIPTAALAGLALLTVSVGGAAPAESSATAPRDDQTAASPSAGAPPMRIPVPLRREIVGGARALIPEGSYFLATRGVLRRSEQGRVQFLADEFAGGDDAHAGIPLAPAPATRDVRGVSDGQRVELSGEVLTYRGMNWIVPDSIVLVGEAPPTTESALLPPLREEEPLVAAAAAEEAPIEPAAGGSEDAQALMRRLRERVGDIARSSAPAVIAEETADAVPEEAVRARLVRRRGVVVRDGVTGGWRFLSATMDGALPDPAMHLLPSQGLEQLEIQVRGAEGPFPILLSGRVVDDGPERWVRVGSWELPRTGRRMLPAGAVVEFPSDASGPGAAGAGR